MLRGCTGQSPAGLEHLSRKSFGLDLEACIDQLFDCKFLPEHAAIQLCTLAQELLCQERNVEQVECPLVVVGDIHGHFHDLLQIFEVVGTAPDKHYLFLGDYVDRGKNSVESVQLLLALKVRHPDRVHLLRGNHEARSVTQVYGFFDEVCRKYGNAHVWGVFNDLFDFLPLSCVIAGEIFCTHGGLSPSIRSLDDIRQLCRFDEIPHEGPICDLMWSDPCDQPGWGASSRGAGFFFGPDITDKFLQKNGLTSMCRAHQLVMEGYNVVHDEEVVTLFSAPNYCGHMGNKGAIMEVDEGLSMRFRQFEGMALRSSSPLAGTKVQDFGDLPPHLNLQQSTTI